MLVLNGCSDPDDLAIKAYGQRCGEIDYAKTSVKIGEHEGKYHITISGDGLPDNGRDDCYLVVDKKSGKIDRVMLGQ